MKELDELYKKCLNSYEIVLALYPGNAKVVKLKEEYGMMFKVFEEASPISKNLAFGLSTDNLGKSTYLDKEAQYVPSYSLGLTQMTPKNLVSDIEDTGKAYIEGRTCDNNNVVAGKQADSKISNVSVGREMVEYKNNDRSIISS